MDEKELAKYFPLTMAEVAVNKSNKPASFPKKEEKLSKEEELLKSVRKRLDAIALSKGSTTKNKQIIDEIKEAVIQEQQEAKQVEEALVGNEKKIKVEKENIISELKSLYENEQI